MGSSAKITRGGNKQRANPRRQQAKLQAQGGKAHTATVKDAMTTTKAAATAATAVRRLREEKARALTTELRARAQAPAHAGSLVRMTPKTAALQPQQQQPSSLSATHTATRTSSATHAAQ